MRSRARDPREGRAVRPSVDAGAVAAEAVTYRWAQRGEVDAIADLLLHASGNVLRFLLAELAPDVSPRALLVHLALENGERRSFRHCLVALLGGNVVGVANVFPAELFRSAAQDRGLSPREEHLRPVTEMQDWDSFVLSGLAVDPRHRGRGIGSGLIEQVSRHARANGYDRLTLHVWADNEPAQRLYRRTGFTVAARADVADHPELSHRGGSVLMRRMLDSPDPRAAAVPLRASPRRSRGQEGSVGT